MISEFTEVLPLHKDQLKKADRTTLIRLALHFIKMKELLGSAISGEPCSPKLDMASCYPYQRPEYACNP